MGIQVLNLFPLSPISYGSFLLPSSLRLGVDYIPLISISDAIRQRRR